MILTNDPGEPSMRVVDGWRLTGPNLHTPRPAALVDVTLPRDEDAERAFALWKDELARMASAVGLTTGSLAAMPYRGGLILVVEVPIDVLLAAVDVGSWAAESAAARLAGGEGLPLEPTGEALRSALALQRNERLLALEREAVARRIPLLWDDELVTLGSGAGGRTWPLGELPSVDEVPWATLRGVPTALVTGTNGKTTTSRLLARMARCAGLCVGSTSTDGVAVGEVIVCAGDYTGPAGARSLLRDEHVELAVLETARGGILRRGLAVTAADVAVVTNVSEDHLGDYGVEDTATMARVKGIIASVVPAEGRVVLNADDPLVAGLAARLRAPVSWFSLAPDAAFLTAHVARGGDAFVLDGDALVHLSPQGRRVLAALDDVPIAFGGAARFNVANALAAAAAATALGLPEASIVAGLKEFTPNADENPARTNVTTVPTRDGVARWMLDFGHNPSAVRSVLELAERLVDRQGRLAVIAGAPGNRSDEAHREMMSAVATCKPARVWLRDLVGYLKGREAGEVPARMRATLLEQGMDEEAVEIASSEAEAVTKALEWARDGDLVLVLAHLEREAVRALLAGQGG